MNPQHTVPLLEDNGVYLADSHAICIYLLSKYAEEDHYLYPSDLMKRAQIDQRLHFDSYMLYRTLHDADIPVWFGAPAAPEPLLNAIHAALALLDAYLVEREYLVGDGITLADIACLFSTIALQIHLAIESDRYPNVCAWMERMSASAPNHDEMIEQKVNILRKKFLERQRINSVLIKWTPKHMTNMVEGFQRMLMAVATEAADEAAGADGEATSQAVDVSKVYNQTQ